MRKPLFLLPALLLAFAGLASAPAEDTAPQETIPFFSTGTAQLAEEDLLEVLAVALGFQPSAHVQASDAGKSHPLGPFESDYNLTVALADPVTLQFSGEFTSELADESSITFALEVSLSLVDGAFLGTFHPTSGTGRYEGVSGCPGDISTSGVAALLSGTFHYESNGVVQPIGKINSAD